jgi:hypothetical protein
VDRARGKGPRDGGAFAGLPKTHISAGAAEQTLDGIRVLCERIVADNGEGRVVFDAPEDATYDFLLAPCPRAGADGDAGEDQRVGHEGVLDVILEIP